MHSGQDATKANRETEWERTLQSLRGRQVGLDADTIKWSEFLAAAGQAARETHRSVEYSMQSGGYTGQRSYQLKENASNVLRDFTTWRVVRSFADLLSEVPAPATPADFDLEGLLDDLAATIDLLLLEGAIAMSRESATAIAKRLTGVLAIIVEECPQSSD